MTSKITIAVPTRKFRMLLTGVATILAALATGRASGDLRTFVFTAEVTVDSTLVDDVAGLIPGDIISGYITFDLAQSDSLSSTANGRYIHTASPASLYSEVEGLIFQTNPAGAVKLDVRIDNEVSEDLYLASSSNNIANVTNPPFLLDFQLVDSTPPLMPDAITDDDQPSVPYDLADFDAYDAFGSRFLIQGPTYAVFAEILSLELNLIVADDGFATSLDCDAPTAVCFSTIQDAIDALGSGDLIEVCPGDYLEDIEFPIGKNDMELMAVDLDPAATTIKGQANVASASFPLVAANVHVLGDGIEIHGFTIQGPDPVAGFYSSGTVIGGDDAFLHDNAFEVTNAGSLADISQGIQTYRDAVNPTGGNVDGLLISNNTFTHHGAGGAGYEAIYVNHVSSDPTPAGTVTIQNNSLTGELIRGITSERSRTEVHENTIRTTLAPVDGSLDPGESLQAVNIVDLDGRDQQDVSILRNAIGTKPSTPLIITGVIDGPLSGGVPKAVELYATEDIADLSDFGIGSANNGGGSDGEEFSFPADVVSAGTFIYVATESTGFTSFFGFAPDYTSSAASINGDDAIELFQNASVIDVFGDINASGTGQPWEYLDGWAYRTSMTGGDGSTFALGNWFFSGTNALDGETTNGSAATPFPAGTFSASAAGGFSQGVRLGSGDGLQALSGIAVEENTVNGNDIGVLVRSGASGVTILDNDLSCNLTFGAENTHSDLADASGNWWGDFDASIVGASVGVFDGVDYTPWLAVGTDIGAGVGFQGDFSTLYVDDDSPQPTGYGRIQEGIDLVTASTVHVLDGTYIEQVVINKSVNLLGANVGIDPNTAVRGAESVVLVDDSDPDPSTAPYPLHFYVTADDVVIDGFTLDGDNPALTSGVLLNGADLDAEEAIASYEGIAGITVQNNILRNTSYTGIDLYNYYNSGGATSGNTIRDNLIENLGAFNWGIGILIYNNFYADIEDNVLNDVRVGIQTGNFYQANPGASGTISNNTIASRRSGIFYNLHYSNASPFSLIGNDISGVNDPTAPVDARWFGMLISSQSGAVDADFIGNVIDGSSITGYLSAGIVAWNTPTTASLTIDGGTVSGVDYGVWVNNFEGYNSDGNDTSLYVNQLFVDAADIGVYVLDSPDNTNGSAVFTSVTNNSEISGASIAGVKVEGADASASLVNNLASIIGNTIGVEVDAGTALLESNNLSGNTTAGLFVHNDALVDAGDLDDLNVTGLGTGSGATNGSSIGCNFLAGYNGTSSFAVIDENLDIGGNIDVQAEGNFWGTQTLSEIETIVDHTVDDSDQTEVFFSNPKTVPQLIMSAPELCQNNGPAQIQVTLSMANLPIAVTGYFAVIQYDPDVLEFDSGTYDFGGFPIHLNATLADQMPMSPVGLILADGSAAPMTSGTDQDQQLATLTFNVIGCGETTIGFGPPPTPSIMSQVSFEGIGLTTELIADSALIDTGIAPAPDGALIAMAGPLNNSCESVVTLSATIVDDCCMDLMSGASVNGAVGILSGNATLGTPSFSIVQGSSSTEVFVTATVSVTLNDGCSAMIEFSLNGSDCCGNAMTTASVTALVEDTSPPTFLTPPTFLDITIECDESTEPGILLGSTAPSSGIAVYYNDNGVGEDGNTNVAYMKAQAGYANTNGAPFTFSSAPLSGNGVNWSFLFGQVAPTQHGLDMVLPAPTWDFITPIPGLSSRENTNNTIGGSIVVGPTTFAVNDYKGSAPNGPANPLTSIIHSLIRSATGDPTLDVQDVAIDVSQSGSLYTAEISGRLVSDNLIHWYTIGIPDSPMSNFALDGEFYFGGTLVYDSTGDTGTDLIDFYSGSITVSANSPNFALGFPLANDNCSAVPSLSYIDVVTPGNCVAQVVSTIDRTWTATDDCGNDSTFLQIITVVDTTSPEVEQPADIEIPADAGAACNAFVTVPPLAASDNCTSLTITNDRTGTADATDTYPVGTTEVIWTVVDDCGNSTMVSQNITVLDFNLVNVVVELTDLNHGVDTPLVFDRNLRFVLNNGTDCSNDICELNVTFSGSLSTTPTAFVSFMAPCDDWISVCVKDDQLTVYDNVTLDGSGASFVGNADLLLRSGDSDNDGDVDINDVTFLLFTFGSAGPVPDACPFDGVRSADFSVNGAVGSEDYSIVQGNWLTFTACDCTMAALDQDIEDLGIELVPTRPLDNGMPWFAKRAHGKRVLRLRADEVSESVADIVDANRDGVIDDKDVRILEDRFGLSHALSEDIRRSIRQNKASRSATFDVRTRTQSDGRP